MFYSDTILARKGPLASIWLAAHWDRRLSKQQIMTTDVSESIREVMSGQLPPMALRLSGQLLLGASKIYHRKARYLLDDCTDALTRLRLSSSNTVNQKDVDLSAEQVRAGQSAVINDTVPQQQQAQIDDDSFDLEGFLNAPVQVEPAITTTVPRKQLQIEIGRNKNDAIQQQQQPQPVSFGGGAGDDLLDEFAGLMEEVEVGRRQSSLPNGRPSDSSVLAPPPLELPDTMATVVEGDDDVGDEELELRSLKDSLPYSPLRPSTIGTPKQQQQPEAVFSSPASSVKRRRNAGTDNPTTRRRRIANLLDHQTELSNNELQSQLRHHDDLLLATADTVKQSAAGSINEPVSLSELLSKPGALLLPAGTDLSGLFAATMSIAPSVPTVPVADVRDSLTAVVEDDPFMDDALVDSHEIANEVPDTIDAVSVASERPSQTTTTVDWATILKNKPVTLSSLIRNRKDAADLFYQTLTMAGRGLVRPEQPKPFGPITVHPLPALFS